MYQVVTSGQHAVTNGVISCGLRSNARQEVRSGHRFIGPATDHGLLHSLPRHRPAAVVALQQTLCTVLRDRLGHCTCGAEGIRGATAIERTHYDGARGRAGSACPPSRKADRWRSWHSTQMAQLSGPVNLGWRIVPFEGSDGPGSWGVRAKTRPTNALHWAKAAE